MTETLLHLMQRPELSAWGIRDVALCSLGLKLCSDTYMMEMNSRTVWLMESRNWTGAIRGMNFARCRFKQTQFKLPPVVSTDGINDASLLLKFTNPADYFAGIFMAFSAYTSNIGAIRHRIKREKLLVIIFTILRSTHGERRQLDVCLLCAEFRLQVWILPSGSLIRSRKHLKASDPYALLSDSKAQLLRDRDFDHTEVDHLAGQASALMGLHPGNQKKQFHGAAVNSQLFPLKLENAKREGD